MTRFFNIIPGDGEVAVLLYGDVGDGQKVDSARVVGELLDLSARYRKIDVRINSCGGDVFSGIAIYNALRTSKADVTIYVDGVAASIAGVIALCGKPLYMSPYARLMLHAVSGGTYGSAGELRKTAEAMDALQDDLARMVAGRCGMDAKDVAARYFDGADHWIGAREAVDMGLADGIYDMEAAQGEAPGTPEEIYAYFTNRLLSQPQNKDDMALIDSLRAIPQFEGVADEQAALARARELSNKAAKADALEKANEAYKKQIDGAMANEAKAMLDRAEAEGKITKEQRPSFEALMASDRKNAEALLGSMRPSRKPRAVDYISQGDTLGGYEGKTWDDLDKEGRLADLKAHDKALFAAKYKERFGVDYKD